MMIASTTEDTVQEVGIGNLERRATADPVVSEEFLCAVMRTMWKTFIFRNGSSNANWHVGLPSDYFDPLERETFASLIDIGYIARVAGEYRMTKRGIQRYAEMSNSELPYSKTLRRLAMQVIYLTTADKRESVPEIEFIQ